MHTRNQSYSVPKSCTHLSDFKVKHGVNRYTHLQSCIQTAPNSRTTVSHLKSEVPRCDFCSGYRGRFYICLVCSAISCCLSPDSNHAHLHSRSKKGHEIAVDVDRAELYCCVCCDQVYDPDFDRIVVYQYFAEMPKSNENTNTCSKRTSSLVELDLMKSKQCVVLRRDLRLKTVYPLGLRGLNNLGSTCFMNSVLQALLHAPPLRNYFLSDRHHRKFCRKRSADQLCLPCDIDCLFSAVFSGERTPYSPAQFLHSWWLHSENLATYEQQDAHEFFISVLDQIHEKESKNLKLNRDVRDCECIAHRVFSGLLRSDVTCATCGSISSTYDPCVDISLDLDMQSASPSHTAHRSSNATSDISTLTSCLEHFTRSEKLGSDQKLYCENCQDRQESLKQMSFRHLPLVLCLHIKRFEHSHVRRTSRKIDQYVQFPFSLDMNPYISSSVVRSRHRNRVVSFDDDEADTLTEYEIFAVVTHSGMLESGHYVTFLRLYNQWYKCDDAWIMEVDEGTVRASQCYMIFYLQKTFYHETSEDLSCSLLSPRRDPFLPIAGCC